MRIERHRLLIATSVCIVATAALLSRSYLPRQHPDAKAVSAAQDEVYEAVVQEMNAPEHGQRRISQLVFDDALLLNEGTGIGPEGCKKAVLGRLPLASDQLPYNSWFDKAYRFVTRGWGEGSVGAEAMEDYVRKLCIPGNLSRTFRTDLPRTFISGESVHFEGWPVEKNGPPSFEKLFPGAGGIISFSRVGFNSALDEAVVSTSVVCGGLCGSGWRHFLKKRRGRWQITGASQVWVA
ncbi:MAG: hypothetical protein WCE61_03660 [Candidatus Acidiferrum sp.]